MKIWILISKFDFMEICGHPHSISPNLIQWTLPSSKSPRRPFDAMTFWTTLFILNLGRPALYIYNPQGNFPFSPLLLYSQQGVLGGFRFQPFLFLPFPFPFIYIHIMMPTYLPTYIHIMLIMVKFSFLFFTYILYNKFEEKSNFPFPFFQPKFSFSFPLYLHIYYEAFIEKCLW